MLERLIYFKKEINILLEEASNLSNSRKDNLRLEKYNISSKEWEFLEIIKKILEVFRKPTIKF